MSPHPLLGGVLVGGESRRMGRPKQLADIGGVTMIEHVVCALQGDVDEIVLLGDGPIPASLGGLPRTEDAADCRGPIAGVLGAMRAMPEACWVITPCDLPKLRGDAVRWLVSSRQLERWIVFPTLDGFLEPLLAVYEPRARLLLERAAAAGEYALHRLGSNSRVVLAEPPAELRACWSNANTPHELEVLRAG